MLDNLSTRRCKFKSIRQGSNERVFVLGIFSILFLFNVKCVSTASSQILNTKENREFILGQNHHDHASHNIHAKKAYIGQRCHLMPSKDQVRNHVCLEVI